MGSITDRFHEENYIDKITPLGVQAKYLIEIEKTGEIVVGVISNCNLYIQKIDQDAVIWVPLNEKCTLIKNLYGII